MSAMNDRDLIETNIESTRVFDGVIIHIDHLINRLPDGSEAVREVARHVGASAVLPVDENNDVYLVRQYRAPIDRVTLEIPAGKLDNKKEDRLKAAKRELSEETGLQADEWVHLDDILTTVGFCDECISLYLAKGLRAGKAHPDSDEFLNVVRMPLAKAVEMVMNNEIHDAKTVCALLMADRYLRQ